MNGAAHIIRGNALALPLPDASVDLVCSSPPYFGLRSYSDNGEHYAGQLGSEPTPAEFLDALIAATAEMVRVLKPSGSIFVNLGDKYAGSNGASGGSVSTLRGGAANARERGAKHTNAAGGFVAGGAPTKSLIGIPWRYAIRCIDQLGLILRAEIIWSKPNGLPESVTDRVRRSHEQWFHFTVQPRYFAAVDEIREAHARLWDASNGGPFTNRKDTGKIAGATDRNGQGYPMPNPLGKLPSSVWTIPSQPLVVPPELGIDHFAAYPMEWPRRIIQGWSPRWICTACGEGRRPVAADLGLVEASWGAAKIAGTTSTYDTSQSNGMRASTLGFQRQRQITGYACACPDTTAPTTPSTILDPFGGTGTTALMAKALGRTGISVDLSGDYCRLARWRTNDPGQMAAALQVEKPEPVHPDQLDLFSEELA